MVTAIEGPQTYASDRRVTGFGQQHTYINLSNCKSVNGEKITYRKN